MNIRRIDRTLSVSDQIAPSELGSVAAAGFQLVVCNRPDGEEPGQPTAAAVAAAAAEFGLTFVHLPFVGEPDLASIADMERLIGGERTPILAYCRTGRRSEVIARRAWALYASRTPSALATEDRRPVKQPAAVRSFDVIVVGGGAAGIATAASLLKRRPRSRIAVIEPSADHFYQPGWTMVGAGIFTDASTKRRTRDVMPDGVEWIQASAVSFDPEADTVGISNGLKLRYGALVVATGLKLDWDAIPGLAEALGRNGVTSNYRYDLAPYTDALVRDLKAGRAVFTQPPMPIKCAGAPQKALYLSCDAWARSGRLGAVEPVFHTATPALFGVADYVPALMSYISRYGVALNLKSRLVAVDGDRRVAVFERMSPDGTPQRVEEKYDMLHVCPPQVAPAAVASSPLAGADGFVEVDPVTLRHTRHGNVFALGDVASTTNAKTAAAVRKQAPIVASNVAAVLDGTMPTAQYDGYGSCPLTVERGRIVLAEFGYGGRLLPTFPRWLLDGTRPTRLAWHLKARLLPRLYWHAMLKGREWMTGTKRSV